MPTTPTLHNIGSINIDWVYQLPAIVRPGETLSSSRRERFVGGKGANQSVAAARAGQRVEHIGRVGQDGGWLTELLEAEGIGTQHLMTDPETPTGHAIIQVDRSGENAIFLLPGANHRIDRAQLDRALATATPDDWVLTQNETGNAQQVIELAEQRGLRCAFNPAPITEELRGMTLESLAVLVVNETESRAFVEHAQPEAVVRELGQRVSGLAVLTRGANGVMASDGRQVWNASGRQVPVVRDTTAAGDTFTGFLIAALMAEQSVDDALATATSAAALAVTRDGAIPSIPTAEEAARFIAEGHEPA
ncbi:MAG: ribokinase [Planctomycetota bacterium]